MTRIRAALLKESSSKPTSFPRICLPVVLAVGAMACAPGNGITPPLPTPRPGTYVLLSPVDSNVTYLMDRDGQLVHQWRSDYPPAYSVYLLENGLLLRTGSPQPAQIPGGNGGRVETLDWDGKVTWRFDYMDATHQQHHDVRRLPNGHILLVAWEKRSGAEARAAGRRPDTIPEADEVWVDHLVEVDPLSNQIVWVWRLWDHLLPPGAAPADHPELVDPNAGATADTVDWTHVNAVDYDPIRDEILLSVRSLSEIWIIDHSTTTTEAAGHTGGRQGRGGDLLFRWGQPELFGGSDPQQLFGQHNAHWIPAGLPGAGRLLVFDNGDRTARPYSRVVELAPVLDAADRYVPGEASSSWSYRAEPPESFFAPLISGARRLPTGTTVVCDGPAGRVFEVSTDGQVAWTHTVADTAGRTGVRLFRAEPYDSSFAGLAGRSLAALGPLQVELTTAGSNTQ